MKWLAAIHDLGSMAVPCTDRTGTLTEARIRVERHVDGDGNDNRRVIELAYLNSHSETGPASAVDEGVLDHERSDVNGWT